MKSHLWIALISGLMFVASSRVMPAALDVLPAGAILNIRTTQSITADSSYIGMHVVGVVDDPVTDAGGRLIIPRGSPATLETVNVRRSSNLKGRDHIMLKVLSVRVAGHNYPVSTSTVDVKGPSEGNRAAWKIGGGAGLGAAVGGLLGGGTGAVVGAATGGTTGAIIAGSGKTHLLVPAETRLQFRLEAPVRVHH